MRIKGSLVRRLFTLTLLAVGLVEGAEVLALDSSAAVPRRVPVADGTLKAIMGGIGDQMSVIQAALWVEDYARIEGAAKAISAHPNASMSERSRLLSSLGFSFPGFVSADGVTHEAADALAAAAASHKMPAVLSAFQATTAACVSCHQDYASSLRKK